MSGFLEELEELGSNGRVSIMDTIFKDPEVDQSLKDELLVALIHPKFRTVDILRGLERRGFKLGETTLRRYRTELSALVLSLTKENKGA